MSTLEIWPSRAVVYHGDPPQGPLFYASAGEKTKVAKEGGFPLLKLPLPGRWSDPEKTYDALRGHGLLVRSPEEYCMGAVMAKMAALASYLPKLPVVMSDAVWQVGLPGNGQVAVNKPTTREEAATLTEFLGHMALVQAELASLTVMGVVNDREQVDWYSFTTRLGPLKPDLDVGKVGNILRGNGHIAAGFTAPNALQHLVSSAEIVVECRRLNQKLEPTSVGLDIPVPVASDNQQRIHHMSLGFIG